MAVDGLTYTISEAAAAIGIGRSMLYKLINDGGLRTVHIGKRVLTGSSVTMLDHLLVGVEE